MLSSASSKSSSLSRVWVSAVEGSVSILGWPELRVRATLRLRLGARLGVRLGVRLRLSLSVSLSLVLGRGLGGGGDLALSLGIDLGLDLFRVQARLRNGMLVMEGA